MQQINNIFNKLGQIFYPDLSDRRNPNRVSTTKDRRKSDKDKSNKSSLALKSVVWCIIVIGMLTSMISFVFGVNFFSTSLQRLQKNPLVVNLSEQNLVSKFKFDEYDHFCNSKDPSCWLSKSFNDSTWEEAVLPEFHIKTQKDYQKWVDKGATYYRISFEIPENLMQLDEEIAFTPMYINHGKYRVYRNGQFVYSGDGSKGNYPIMPIPKDEIKDDGVVNFQVWGELSSTSIGIRHRGALYLGPKAALDALTVNQERSRVSFYLLFLLSKGSIFVIFSLFFFFSRNRTGLAYFLVFVFFTTVESLYPSGLLSPYLSEKVRIILFFSGQAIAFSALLAFYGEFLQSNFVSRVTKYFFPFSLTLSLISSYDFNWGSHTLAFKHLLWISQALIMFTIAIGIVAGFIKYKVLKRLEAKENIIFSTKTLAYISCAYLILLIWEFGFNEYKGFDLRSLFDLVFFYFVAFLTAREFGFNEKRVVTFDAIKQEKDRMAQELQEAAVIAKTFTPDSPPEWNEYEISVFHEPMTESGGDWFSFTQEGNSDYKHFIMCDVTGHGVQAALIVSACKTALSLLENTHKDSQDFITEYVKKLNRVLYEQGEGHHTTTFLGLTFNKNNSEVLYFAAAHPPSLIIREQGKFDLLMNRHPPLGMTPEVHPSMQGTSVSLNDVLFVYSDGITLGTNKRLMRHVMAQGITKKTSHLAKECVGLVRDYEIENRGYLIPDDTTLISFKKVS